MILKANFCETKIRLFFVCFFPTQQLSFFHDFLRTYVSIFIELTLPTVTHNVGLCEVRNLKPALFFTKIAKIWRFLHKKSVKKQKSADFCGVTKRTALKIRKVTAFRIAFVVRLRLIVLVLWWRICLSVFTFLSAFYLSLCRSFF